MSLAQEVTRRRDERGWTREELAAATRGVVSKTTITDIENEKTLRPRRATLHALAMALDCTVDDLTGREPMPVAEPEGPEERRLLEDYRTLNVENRASLRAVLRGLVLQQRSTPLDQE